MSDNNKLHIVSTNQSKGTVEIYVSKLPSGEDYEKVNTNDFTVSGNEVSFESNLTPEMVKILSNLYK